MKKKEFSVIIHGGAGRYVKGYPERKLTPMKAAIDAAWIKLTNGAPGEQAVAAALRVMEESEFFNAGFGGYPNADGIVLLDVGLMKGTGEFLSLVNVRRIKFPSLVALDMLEEKSSVFSTWTHELMLKAEKAPDDLKERYGLVDSHEDLFSPYVKELIRKHEGIEVESGDEQGGTIGCVVRDGDGKLFAGTSTGGTIWKYNGRIGDSPIIGCGVYADNEVCAFSTSGHGEGILKTQFANFVIAELRRAYRENKNVFVENPNKLKEIIDAEIAEHESKTQGRAAIIIMPPRGLPHSGFNSEMLSGGIRIGTADSFSCDEVWIKLKDGTEITPD